MTAASRRIRDGLVPRPLRIPSFRRLVLANLLTRLGGMVTYVALPVVVWEATGSSGAFAGVLALGTLGIVLGMPLGGVLADRLDRRLLMLVGDAKGAVGALAVLGLVHLEAWAWLAVASLLNSLLGSLFVSAAPALRREALPDELREQGAAALQLGVQSAVLAGPALGAALLAQWSFTVVVAVEVVLYLCSFVVVWGLRLPRSARRPRGGAAPGGGSILRAGLADLRDGAALSITEPFLRAELAYSSAAGVSNAILLVAGVPWLVEHVGMPGAAWGLLISLLGAAGLVASLVLSAERATPAAGSLLLVGTVSPLAVAPVFAGWSPVVAVAAAFATFGAAHVAARVATEAVRQRRIAAEFQGRSTAAPMAVFQLAMLVGAGLATVAIEAASPLRAMQLLALVLAAEAVAGIAMWGAARTAVPLPVPEGDLAVSG